MYIDSHEHDDVVIRRSLLNAGRNMKSVLSFMTTIETSFQHLPDFQSHKVYIFG